MNINLNHYAYLLGAIILMQSCGQKGQENQQMPGAMPKSVITTIANKETVTNVINYPATVVALNETDLRAEVSGYVTQIFVQDGQSVSRGQKLYEIDRVRYESDVQQAKANLQIAEANYSRTEKDLERYRKLAEQDAIARQTLDYAETDLNNQKAQIQAAKAALLTAQTNMERSLIKAPFNGTIGISQVRLGALVSQGTTLLNTISSTDPIALEFQVTDREIDRVIELQNNKSAGHIQAILPTGELYSESGYVTMIDRKVDHNTGTLKVRASFANPEGKLRAGMNLTLSISSQSAEDLIVIPHRAVIEQLGVFSVYTVNDSSKAEIHTVELGSNFGSNVAILKGLSVGDKVVVDGANNLVDGDTVKESDSNN